MIYHFDTRQDNTYQISRVAHVVETSIDTASDQPIIGDTGGWEDWLSHAKTPQQVSIVLNRREGDYR
jgi:hypothetical protein